MTDLDHEQLCKELRHASVVLEIDAISHLSSHSCYLVNDAFLLSYRQALDIHRRSKAAQTLTGRVSGLAERFMGWLLQAIYRWCFASQTPVKMERQNGKGNPEQSPES